MRIMWSPRRAFSLLELAMVVTISGLMVGYVLKLSQSAPTLNSTECAAQTKGKLTTIRDNIERFARQNDRLPMPARRNVGPDDPLYGRESDASGITQAGGVSFGAVPFQALGLDLSHAGDCWGNKLTYAVWTALTEDNNSTGFLNTNVLGDILL